MHSEKISVPLTDELFSEIKHLNEQNRFFYQLLHRYMERKKRESLRAELEQGYMEMAQLNLSIAESFAYSEWEAFHHAESRQHVIHYE
ncbi:hypothetical protein [Natribacillus halophilus]|uniref:CopG family transcriptional regulator / antitoxin EndoAI n=1 Tax=Natribacillus halophilus TaxID=549003 RepID=A0A1G8J7L4_9BACI|nr:hypothetical protein [Natribacillus halophilus]SDI27239.1 CopG family transcriptional regulator / antitoxin EndoAI [Natribacillus halophilus]